MANTASARKELRKAVKRQSRNLAKKKDVKEAIAAAQEAIEAGSDKAAELISTATKALDKAAKANVIHANKAARLKSRLQKKAAKK